VIAAIAAHHGKTAPQVMLRWHLQQGRSAIPKSTRPARIAENFDVFDFRLSDFELARIDALDKGVRPGPEPADHAGDLRAQDPRGLTWVSARGSLDARVNCGRRRLRGIRRPAATSAAVPTAAAGR
jgi:hypothetical protein